MCSNKDRKTIGVFAKMDDSTYLDLQWIKDSHGFDSDAQALRWSIRQTARIEKQTKIGEVIKNV